MGLRSRPSRPARRCAGAACCDCRERRGGQSRGAWLDFEPLGSRAGRSVDVRRNCCQRSTMVTLPNIAAISAALTPEGQVKEALKLFGAMAAIIVSVSVLHGVSARPD